LDDNDYHFYRKYLQNLEEKKDQVTTRRVYNYQHRLQRIATISNEYNQLNGRIELDEPVEGYFYEY
jgi:hypothetical protein